MDTKHLIDSFEESVSQNIERIKVDPRRPKGKAVFVLASETGDYWITEEELIRVVSDKKAVLGDTFTEHVVDNILPNLQEGELPIALFSGTYRLVLVADSQQILYHALHSNIGMQSLRALRPHERFNIPNVPSGEAALSAPREFLIKDDEDEEDSDE